MDTRQMISQQQALEMAATLPAELNELRSIISAAVQREFSNGNFTQKLRFPLHESMLNPEMYTYFRNSPWLLTAGPDPYFGPNMHLAVLRKKVPVAPAPEFCYHATEATNHEEILARGLLTGVRAGRGPRRNTYSDSIHYIFASSTLDEARNWVNRLSIRGDFRIYPVRVHGFDLVLDPCGTESAGNPLGYILTTDHVPVALLGESILVERAS